MENRAIKVNVGGLEYMVRAKSDEHEAVVREAERSLNEMITKYRRLYPKKDIVDLLSFVALNQCITNVGLHKGLGATDVENQKETPDAGVNDPSGPDACGERGQYRFPTMDLLKDYDDQRHNVSREEMENNITKIKRVFQNYGFGVEKVTACKGPAVTLYRTVPSAGTKISAIRRREEDIARSLGQNGVRVVTLWDVVEIEVPNSSPSVVPLKSLLSVSQLKEDKYELPVAIGYTVAQELKVFDLTDAPHILVSGAVQQGKSVCLNVIIASLLYSKHPSEVKFVFIDSKKGEFNAYGRLLKHCLAVLPPTSDEKAETENTIVRTPEVADRVLRSLYMEMEERYRLMGNAAVSRVVSYNGKYKEGNLNFEDGHRYLPYLVVVIDEYADLHKTKSEEVSESISTSIIRLAQRGKAAGIHIILATRNLTDDVVTNPIKVNFPMRIAFGTASNIDSQTILDRPGAEKLIGRGDMLFYNGIKMERIQCAMIGGEEIDKITEFIASQTDFAQPYYLPKPDFCVDSREKDVMTEQDFKDYREYEGAHARILLKTPERQWLEDCGPVLSQCYLNVDGGDENTYTLFLRIRSLDYWSFSVIQCVDTDRPKWYCPDGFPYFEQEQLKAAEAWAEYWYETHKDHIPELFEEEEDI